MRSIVLALSFALILLTGCTTVTNTPPSPAGTDSSSSAADIPLLSGMHTVTLKTSLGDITLELDADVAPKTVTNFITHAKNGYFDDLTFHRVIKDFMIQGGDPAGTGMGGESIFGGTFEDEINATSYKLDTMTIADVAPADQLSQLPEEMRTWSLKQYYEAQGYHYRDDLTSLPMVKGAIAMANRGPATNGSQFFIVHAASTPWLDGKHTVFGNVTEGMDVIDVIANVAVGEGDAPEEKITFTVEVAD
ncbi:MAG TPA: peptidylprolyl isomerase [Candidatus Peribacterales bacterium]|nr:peptidylprolyl isomerase [Candidatus Peribacterales bacterium]